jgi:hypothetical protein
MDKITPSTFDLLLFLFPFKNWGLPHIHESQKCIKELIHNSTIPRKNICIANAKYGYL